jgi:SPP1 gp7 family putative phage head morphogenesis protein
MGAQYWQDRMQAAQDLIAQKTIKDTEKQLAKYYRKTAEKVINEFEATYNKILATVADGKEPTPADLYKLNKYWEMQANCQKELALLGDKSIRTMQKAFEVVYSDIYHSIALQGGATYNTLDNKMVQQLINQIWCADGKSWSQRIWENTAILQETLNEELLHTVVAGKKGTELRSLLMDRFSVSWSRADALVRTEVAHIQTQAATQRYKDYGIERVQIWADEDERRCEQCGKLHEKIYNINEHIPLPAHPRCRCCVVPVID